MKKELLVVFFLFGLLNIQANEMKFILPNDSRIEFEGALFVEKSEQKVVLSRHNDEFLNHSETFVNTVKANTQSGVSINFICNSPEITLHFEKRENADHRQLIFGIFKNGKFFKQATGLSFTFNTFDSDLANWKVVLPGFYGLHFIGMEIVNEATLQQQKKEDKPVYVAIGNSITHGVGQLGASWLTYPFLLAQEKNWELYNLAVGGSKISWPVANLLFNIQADVITILWGYNDWNSTFTIENEIKPYYKKLLTGLRKVQPKAKIYCILPTKSKRTSPKAGTDTLDDIRKVQNEIATQLQTNGDNNIFVINGEDITELTDLNDDVHLSVEGAQRFSARLGKLIH